EPRTIGPNPQGRNGREAPERTGRSESGTHLSRGGDRSDRHRTHRHRGSLGGLRAELGRRRPERHCPGRGERRGCSAAHAGPIMTAATAAQKMPLSAHMREARTRAVRAAVALLIGTVIGYLTSGLVMDVLRAPITEIAESRSASLNYDSVTGAFDLQVRIALYS